MVNIKETSGLLLAYLGDAVWELNVRKHFIDKGYNIQKANKASKNFVNAKKQSKIFCEIYDELPEEYKRIVNRAKNSNIKTFPKSCTIIEYKEATAFEALIAIFYENNENDKIKELIKKLEGDV
ncbi:MAG: Mini-ribonuclease 3 [Fusobacteriaceae bacterium]